MTDGSPAWVLGLSDPGAFWADLRFPDAWVVDTTAGMLRRLDGG